MINRKTLKQHLPQAKVNHLTDSFATIYVGAFQFVFQSKEASEECYCEIWIKVVPIDVMKMIHADSYESFDVCCRQISNLMPFLSGRPTIGEKLKHLFYRSSNFLHNWFYRCWQKKVIDTIHS
jgi:hypothetical protein